MDWKCSASRDYHLDNRCPYKGTCDKCKPNPKPARRVPKVCSRCGDFHDGTGSVCPWH